jgi:hypothetical protein
MTFLGDRSRPQAGTFNMKRIEGTAVNTTNCFLDPTAPLRAAAAIDRCRAVNAADRPTLFFEGDSHTHSLIPLGGRILSAGRWNVAFHARGGCPFPYFEPRSGNGHKSERFRLCRPHYENTVERMAASLRAGDRLVLVSNLPSYFSSLTGADRQAAETSYHAEIKRVAETARRRGAGLILFGPLPYFDQKKIAVPLSLCNTEWFRPSGAIPQGCRPVLRSRQEVLNDTQPVRNLLINLATRIDGVTYFDPMESLCPQVEKNCSTHRGMEALFSDGNHLTNAGALDIYPRLERLLDQPQTSSQR